MPLQRRDGLAVQHRVGEEIHAGDRDVAGDQADHHGEREPADDVPGDGLQVRPGAQEQPGDFLDGQRRRRDEFASVEVRIPSGAAVLVGLSQSSSPELARRPGQVLFTVVLQVAGPGRGTRRLGPSSRPNPPSTPSDAIVVSRYRPRLLRCPTSTNSRSTLWRRLSGCRLPWRCAEQNRATSRYGGAGHRVSFRQRSPRRPRRNSQAP